jgi:uncharacterized protein (TIGR00730 family)
MKKAHFSLAVYCGSRLGAKPAYATQAQQVGHWIGAHGGRLVYGGGNNGLMGIVAQATLDAGGEVIGVIPKALVDIEVAKTNCTELIVVGTMHERKAKMAEYADAFLAIAGGIGTFEELFEIWAWRHLAYHNKPFGILNCEGYYDALMQFLKHCQDEQFVSQKQNDFLLFSENEDDILSRLINQAGLGSNHVMLGKII